MILAYQLLEEHVEIEEIRTYIESFGVRAPLVFIILYTVLTIFLPSTPLMAIAGILFGFSFGVLYTTIGGLLSSVILFYISRILGQKWVDQVLKHKYLGKLKNYNNSLNNRAIVDLIILRIMPIMPFNVLNILMGVSKITIKDYLIGTLIGLIPSNVVSVYAGAFLIKLF